MNSNGHFIWDAHAGFEIRSEKDLETLSIWKNAGVDFLSVNIGYDVIPWTDTLTNALMAMKWIEEMDGYRLAGTLEEIDAAQAAGDMAIAFDIEGMDAITDSVEFIETYHDLGVRQILIAYNINNMAGGGCHDKDIGLTTFGRAAVERMNALGMLVDCSHCSYRTTMDVMTHSSHPVIFSHSNARILREHERNILDEQAVRCAGTGGVVGVNGIGHFVGDDDISTASVTDHIEHYLDLIGPDHVGIGLDYFHETGEEEDLNERISENTRFWPKSQYPGKPIRCAAPSQLHEIAKELDRRGHGEATIKGVLGGNFRRLADALWIPSNPERPRIGDLAEGPKHD